MPIGKADTTELVKKHGGFPTEKCGAEGGT
jgi:hypothetical protein